MARTGVIALVGIAPKGPVNELVQVLNATDAAQFGSEIPGFNIPEALNVILGIYGAAPVLVVNVFDPATHIQAVSNESVTVSSKGTFKLAYAPISGLVITTSGGSPVTLVKGTDYTVDDYGNVAILTRVTYPNGTTLKAAYNKADFSAITGSLIVGAIDGDTGVRTGMKLFEEAYTTYGYKAKQIIAPRYSTLSSVRTAMLALANSQRGIAYIDAPIGTTVSGAISARGPAGNIGFNISNERAELLYPHIKRTDPSTGDLKLVPMSTFIAGLRNYIDNKFGFWYSTSNNEILGNEGVERAITADISDPNSEANALNEVGISTVFSSFGTGIRAWGNYSSAWPSVTSPNAFVVVRRIADTVYDSLELAMLQFIDKPINANGLISEIKQTANYFINTLIQRGALIIGSKCEYLPEDNPATEIALGHLTFTLTLMGAIPAQRITFKAVLDTNLLSNLSKAA